MSDAREEERARGRWWESFDASTLTITVNVYDEDGDDELVTFPMKFAVCGLCEGRGKHVNPSIDAHGIPAHELHDDPDFAEAYHSGTYDVPCFRCGGQNVEPVVDLDSPRMTAATHQLWIRHELNQRAEAEWRAIERMERRMGA